MSDPAGNFAWYELMTTDPAAAEAFYDNVIGWTSSKVGSPEMPYTVFNAKDVGIAGMIAIPPEAAAMGAGPSWIGYIHVDDVDAYVTRVVEAGGSVKKPVTVVPGMLRFAVMADPQGAFFVLFTSDPGMQSPPNRPVPPETGTIGWHELYTTDLEAATDFYFRLFGWTKESDMDMGPMGIYRLFADGGKQAGGMMAKPPHIPMPFWTYYIHVDGANAAIERLKAAGGTVANGPHQVPGGQWIVQATDPQGASFALVSNAA